MDRNACHANHGVNSTNCAHHDYSQAVHVAKAAGIPLWSTVHESQFLWFHEYVQVKLIICDTNARFFFFLIQNIAEKVNWLAFVFIFA